MSFLKLLSEYGPSAQNNAAFDEHVKKRTKKLGIEDLNIDNGLLTKLFETFISSPKSIIISGSAGDGKTYLLRGLFDRLSADNFEWLEFLPIIQYKDYQITFIKDFTQLSIGDKKNILNNLYTSIFTNTKHLYFIAANDGILTDTLRDDSLFIDIQVQKDNFSQLLKLIEDKIDHKDLLDNNLLLLDLSQTSSAKNFDLLLNTILEYCDTYNNDCPSLHDSSMFCSIHANINLLKDKTVQERLISIIETCDLNYNHISLRKLFMLISNMILGNSDKNSIFKSCEESIKYFSSKNDRFGAAFFNNVFGDNLSQNYKNQKPFKDLRELCIGYETSNKIDNFILYKHNGAEELPILYDKILQNQFFDINDFDKKRLIYMEDGNIEDIEKYLIYLRRYLYFTLNDEETIEKISFNLDNLRSYRYIEDFHNSVILPLKNKGSVNKRIIKKLVLGLNRLFLGELISEHGSDRLYIATSPINSIAKISSEILTDLEYTKKGINEGLTLKYLEGFDEDYCKISLQIYKYGKLISELELDLHMFEFLMRVSEGILPTSFSVEYYEKILGFKSQIVNYILENYTSENDNSLDSTFRMFSLNDKEGIIIKYELEIENNHVCKS